jgi:hypothetical protein
MMPAMGRKYDALGVFLAAQTRDRVHLSFDQIERIIGSSLPPSAGKHAVWWSNSRVTGRYNEVWLDRGWETTDLNMRARTVGFVRVGLPRRSLRAAKPEDVPSASPAPPPSPSPAQPAVGTPPGAAKHDISMSFEWLTLGQVKLDEGMRLAFPSVAAEPGLYRMRISSDPGVLVYIGESDNLRRRFGNYRNPGPTQQTSLRINQLLREKLAADISMTVNGAEASPNLRDRAVRRMVENAALVASGGTDVELANR